MIPSLNYDKLINIIRKCWASLSVLSHRWFRLFSSHCSLSEPPYRTSFLLLYHAYLRISKSDFSTTHSFFWQRRKQLVTGYHSVHSGTVAPLNSIGVIKWRCHLYATRGFEVFPFIPYLLGHSLSPSHLLNR